LFNFQKGGTTGAIYSLGYAQAFAKFNRPKGKTLVTTLNESIYIIIFNAIFQQIFEW